MLEIANESSLAAGAYPGFSATGEPQMTVVVKACYRISDDGVLSPSPDASAIEDADRYYGDPHETSLAAANEAVPFKRGADLLAFGTARPHAAAKAMEVAIGLNRPGKPAWRKSLHVAGPRYWRNGLFGAMLSEAAALEPLPLRYEYAYGGKDPKRDGREEPRNPVGRGYVSSGWRVKNVQAPQIEQGPKLIRSPAQQPMPAGFGPIARDWMPRAALLREFDEEAAIYGHCPYQGEAPAELYNAAPADQQFDTRFEGGENLTLKGFVADVSASAEISLTLPVFRPTLILWRNNAELPLNVRCDTLVVKGDEREIHLIARAAVTDEANQDAPGWIFVRDASPLDANEKAA